MISKNYDIFADYITTIAQGQLFGTGIILSFAKDNYSYLFEALLNGSVADSG